MPPGPPSDAALSRAHHLLRFAVAGVITVMVASLGALTPRPVVFTSRAQGQEMPGARALASHEGPDIAALAPTADREWAPGEPSGPPAEREGSDSPETPAAVPTEPAPPAAAPVATVPPSERAPERALIHIQGRVLDADRKTPIQGAHVLAGSLEARTDEEGRFTIGPVPAGTTALVKNPGYERRQVPLDRSELTVLLRKQTIKAAYLTYYGIADRGIRERVLDLVERTELNGVVIDVKGDRGLIPYRTSVPQALEAGAQGPVIIKDFDGLMARLKDKHVYTIARIVVFKDNVLANHRKDLAIMDTRTGKPWIDREKLAWLDPFREETWDYTIAIAKEAAGKGFDEIQFDYVRFPTDGRLSAARYAKPNTKDTRLPTIAAFLAKARRELAPTGVFIAADVFGYTAFNENDTDIGQRIEELAPHIDYFSPMVYPSGYHVGIPGVRNPVAHPYEIVKESVRLTRKRASHANVQVRPWLQDFRDYAFDRRVFGPSEVRAQIRGAEEAGATGWMIWNPRNAYTVEALAPDQTALVRPAGRQSASP